MLTVRQFAAAHESFQAKDVAIVRVFHSPMFALEAVFADDPPPFPILADPERTAYRAYGVERSIRSLLHLSVLGRVKESRHEHLKPNWRDAIRDGFTGLPADFLVDAQGLLRRVHYGKDFTDSLSVSDAQEWVREPIPDAPH